MTNFIKIKNQFFSLDNIKYFYFDKHPEDKNSETLVVCYLGDEDSMCSAPFDKFEKRKIEDLLNSMSVNVNTPQNNNNKIKNK